MFQDLSSIQQFGTQIREGKLQIADAVEHYLNKVNERNTELNIVVKGFDDEARNRAEALDEELRQGKDRGPMHGVPIAVKDIFAMTGCVPAAGSGAEIRWGDEEAAVIRKLKASGAIILGTLNLDEFAMGSTNENSAYGSCANPWNLNHCPGGSSGGSAAAVSGQLTPITIGTDTGGSIRQPASFTGTVGLKPTYGSCSRYGIVAFASSLDQAGPMAQNVKDCALLHEVISSYDPKDSTSIDFKRKHYSKELTNNIKGKKIGIPKEYRVDGMPKEIEDLWQKGIQYIKAVSYTHLTLPTKA